MNDLQALIDEGWEARTDFSPSSAPTELRTAVQEVLTGLDRGDLRVAEKTSGDWVTHQWIKKAVLLSFRLQDNREFTAGDMRFWDKVDLKHPDGSYRAV